MRMVSPAWTKSGTSLNSTRTWQCSTCPLIVFACRPNPGLSLDLRLRWAPLVLPAWMTMVPTTPHLRDRAVLLERESQQDKRLEVPSKFTKREVIPLPQPSTICLPFRNKMNCAVQHQSPKRNTRIPKSQKPLLQRKRPRSRLWRTTPMRNSVRLYLLYMPLLKRSRRFRLRTSMIWK